MRALMIPQVVTKELAAESDAYSYRQIMEALSDREPSWFYVWSKTEHEGSDLGRDNWTLFAEESNSLTFYQQMAAFSGRLFETFNRQTGAYPVDAVFTSRAGLVPSLMVGLSTDPSKPVPVVTLEPRVYAGGSVAHNTVTEIDTATRAVGYALGIKVFWSQFEMDEAMRAVSTWMSPGAVKRAEENSFIVPQLVESHPFIRQEDGRKRVMFVGRLNTNKHWDEIMEAYGKVLMTRTDVEVWLHAGTGARRKLDPAQSRWFKTTESIPSHDDYLKVIADTDVSVYASDDEGVNVTVLELLALGVVMWLPDKPWVRKLFDPLEYPFTYSKKRELPELIDYALDNTAAMRADLTPIRDLIASRYGRDPWKEAWSHVFDAIDAWNARNRVTVVRKFKAEVDGLHELYPEGVAWITALSLAHSLKTRPWMRRVFSTYGAYLSVADQDNMSGPIPVLERNGT